MSQSPPPDPKQDPARFDPWSGRGFGNIRWYAASTVIHVVLLIVLATVTLTVMRKVEEVRVKVLDEPASVDDWEGANSLEDIPGVLDVQAAPRRQARPGGPGPVVRNVRAPQMPQIGGVGPKLGRGPVIDAGTAPVSFGAGGGGIGGLGGGFGDYVGGLRKSGLDLVLVIDTTESMQFVIDEVKERATALVTALQRMVPTSRIGIVVYRDQGDEYVVKWVDLSFRTEKLRDFLANIKAAGGGDWEEAVLEGLDAAVHELSWRKKSKKIIILIGGSPPHPEDIDQVQEIVQKFRADGGSLSAIDVTHELHEQFDRFMWKSIHGNQPYQPSPMPEFYQQVAQTYGAIANDGGGELVLLENDKKLIRDVLVLTFGSRWKVEMAKYLKELS